MEKRTVISYDKLYDYMVYMLEKGLKYPRASAEITAKVLVEADARGHASHGVARIKIYHQEVQDGKNHPEARAEVVYETPVSLVIQGNSAPGFPTSQFAVEKTIEKALANGTCMTSIRDSCHYGMAGYWAELIADQGMVGWSFTNTLPAAIPTYGRERLLGTSPVCMAMPIGRKPHFMLDMATTTVPLGKIEVAARRGLPLPEGWAVDEEGKVTHDAVYVAEVNRNMTMPYGGLLYLGGATEVLGGHKGYGLGMLVELLTAGLSLGTATYDTYQKSCGICHYFQAVRLDLFGDSERIQTHMASIVDRIKDSAKAQGQERLYIHGEKEYEKSEKSLKEGIWLDPATWERLDEYARLFGIDLITP
jgi:LDH2 family malate/lactate/ureidoglycolate dehydrogenase